MENLECSSHLHDNRLVQIMMLYYIAIIRKIRISLYNITIVSTISFTSITTIVITITKAIITDIMTVALGTPPPYLVLYIKKPVFRIDTNM